MSHACRHKEASSAIGPGSNHQWAGDNGYHSRMIWVTCPRKFTKAVEHNDTLLDWAEEGFQGPLLWSDILWVLSPDPGCEL